MKVAGYMDGFYKNLSPNGRGRQALDARADRMRRRGAFDGSAGEGARPRGRAAVSTPPCRSRTARAHPGDEEVELVVYFAAAQHLRGATQLGRSSSAFAPAFARYAGYGVAGEAAAALVAPVTIFRRGEPLALMPFNLRPMIIGQPG